MTGLGASIAHRAVRASRPDDHGAPRRHPSKPGARGIQRPRGGDEHRHPPARTHGLRLPQPRCPDRLGDAQARWLVRSTAGTPAARPGTPMIPRAARRLSQKRHKTRHPAPRRPPVGERMGLPYRRARAAALRGHAGLRRPLAGVLGAGARIHPPTRPTWSTRPRRPPDRVSAPPYRLVLECTAPTGERSIA